MDLDDLLDNVDMSKLPDKGGKAGAANTTASKVDDEISAESLKISILSSEIRPWLAASANVPKEIREKWTKMVKTDVDTEVCSRFNTSYTYHAWDAPSTTAKPGVKKALHELVKRTAAKSGLDEIKTAKIASLLNPLTDADHGKQLQDAFTKQILADWKTDILHDPNYSAEKYPQLAKAVNS